MPAAALLTELSRRGFTFRVEESALVVSPASALTPDDRAALRAHRDGLLAILSRSKPWSQQVAIKLMSDADALVEQSGVSGHHPAIQSAAAMVVSAYSSRDLETVRLAVAEFAVVVRKCAAECVRNHDVTREKAQLPALNVSDAHTTRNPSQMHA